MTKYYCDICGEQMFSPNGIKICLSESITRELDVCGKCSDFINKSKIHAEIKAIKILKGEIINETN